jgi:hypothetical protein
MEENFPAVPRLTRITGSGYKRRSTPHLAPGGFQRSRISNGNA